MKKLIIITLVIALIAVILYGGYVLFLKRTPETIIKSVFGISLKDFDYSVETFEEQWVPTGNGRTLIIYKFNKLTQENIDYLKTFHVKRLPISKEDDNVIDFSKVSKEYLNEDVGYYIYESFGAPWDYKVFIIDTVNKKAILHYKLM